MLPSTRSENTELQATVKGTLSSAETVNIHGGTFNNVEGNIIYHYHTPEGAHSLPGGQGLEILRQAISVDALHDSSERFPPPLCHPETRKEVIEIIMNWVDDANSSSRVFWLYASAGAGKTTIMQTVAEKCLMVRAGRLGATFFFSRGKAKRDRGQYLFITIAYQLALNVPGLLEHVQKAMALNPTLPSKSMDIQIRALIIEPFRQLSSNISEPFIVFIDGLDECHDALVQQQILLLIAGAFIAYENLPLRFIVASRPEAQLRESFDSTSLRTITRRVVLDDSFKPNEDIKIFLKEGFNKIYTNTPAMAQVDKPWPSESIIDLLVHKASGQFIYATTILRFVGGAFCHPVKQLEILLEPPAHTPSIKIFTDLDNLYIQILSVYPNPTTVTRVLEFLLASHCSPVAEVIDDVLGLEDGEALLILPGLHSLLRLPGDDAELSGFDDVLGFQESQTGICILHASFHDFLVDRDRSGPFFLDITESDARIARAGFRLIAQWILPSSVSSQSRMPKMATWGYLKWHLAYHFGRCNEETQQEIVSEFISFPRRFWDSSSYDRWDVQFPPLHAAMTVLVHMKYNRWNCKHTYYTSDLVSAALDKTETQVLDKYPPDPNMKVDDSYANIFHQFRDVLDQCYFLRFSQSEDMQDLIRSLPGFQVIRWFITAQAIADVCSVDVCLVQDMLHRNRDFISASPDPESDGAIFRMNGHLVEFLRDESRAGRFYSSPVPQHVAICFRSLHFFYEEHWSTLEKLHSGATSYIQSNYKEHMSHANLDPSVDLDDSDVLPQDHPLATLIRKLKSINYYQPDFRNAPFQNLVSIWFGIYHVIRWAQRQHEVLDGLDYDGPLRWDLRHVTGRICSQILCAEEIEDGVKVTICPTFLACQRYYVLVWDPETKAELCPPFQIPVFGDDARVVVKDSANMRISDDFLLLPDILPSFTEYLTDRTRAGDLYMRPEVLHTQLAEYWLQQCGARYDPSPCDAYERYKHREAGTHWKISLLQALPSPIILDRLRHIYSFSLIGASRPHVDSYKAIIKWLEGLPEPPLDIYIRWQKELLQDEEAEKEREMEKKRKELPDSVPVPHSLFIRIIERWNEPHGTGTFMDWVLTLPFVFVLLVFHWLVECIYRY